MRFPVGSTVIGFALIAAVAPVGSAAAAAPARFPVATRTGVPSLRTATTFESGVHWAVRRHAGLPVPKKLEATPGDRSVKVSWSRDTGATSFEVFDAGSAGGENYHAAAACRTKATTCTVHGLQNGTEYFFTVKALEGTTASAPSKEVHATPSTPGGHHHHGGSATNLTGSWAIRGQATINGGECRASIAGTMTLHPAGGDGYSGQEKVAFHTLTGGSCGGDASYTTALGLTLRGGRVEFRSGLLDIGSSGVFAASGAGSGFAVRRHGGKLVFQTDTSQGSFVTKATYTHS